MGENAETKPNLQIFITGTSGGTGATTAAERVAECLGLQYFSGGQYFRAIVDRFEAFKTVYSYKNPNELYQNFLNFIKDEYKSDGFSGANERFKDHLGNEVDGKKLSAFHKLIERHATDDKDDQIDRLWDRIVDEYLVKAATTEGGYIIDGKLAIFINDIKEFKDLIDAAPEFALPGLKILLTVDVTTAAERVADREQQNYDEVIEQIQARVRDDFNRYRKLYTINGKPVKHDLLVQHADEVIDTTNLTPEEAVTQILETYHTVITEESEEHPELAAAAIAAINEALENISQPELYSNKV